VGPRTGLDRCGISRPHRDSIPRPISSRYTDYATRPTVVVVPEVNNGIRGVMIARGIVWKYLYFIDI
jgi:hypothetical protein